MWALSPYVDKPQSLWVLFHWAHFTVRRFICVYVCVFCVFLYCRHVVLLQHGGVDMVGLEPNPQDLIFLQCFDTVGWSLDL